MLRSWLLIKNDARMPISFTYVLHLAEILTVSNTPQTWSPDLQAAVKDPRENFETVSQTVL